MPKLIYQVLTSYTEIPKALVKGIIYFASFVSDQLQEDAKRKKTDVPTAGATKNHRPTAKEEQATEYTNVLRSNENATRTTQRKGKMSLETNRF